MLCSEFKISSVHNGVVGNANMHALQIGLSTVNIFASESKK